MNRCAKYLSKPAVSSSGQPVRVTKLIRKNFVEKHQLQSDLLSKISLVEGERVYFDSDRRHHKSDGIIFQPDSPYTFSIDSDLLKWKWSEVRSVDLQVVLTPTPGMQSGSKGKMSVVLCCVVLCCVVRCYFFLSLFVILHLLLIQTVSYPAPLPFLLVFLFLLYSLPYTPALPILSTVSCHPSSSLLSISPLPPSFLPPPLTSPFTSNTLIRPGSTLMKLMCGGPDGSLIDCSKRGNSLPLALHSHRTLSSTSTNSFSPIVTSLLFSLPPEFFITPSNCCSPHSLVTLLTSIASSFLPQVEIMSGWVTSTH